MFILSWCRRNILKGDLAKHTYIVAIRKATSKFWHQFDLILFAAPESSYPAQQQAGRTFVPGGGGQGNLSAGKFAESFVNSSKRLYGRMGTNLDFVAKTAKDTLNRILSGGGGA